MACLDTVSKIAYRTARQLRLPPNILVEDLVAVGTLALVQTANRFDSTRGASFSTFAGWRVKGAIFDYIRREAPMSRHACESNDPNLHREWVQLDHVAADYLYAVVGKDVDPLRSARLHAAFKTLTKRERGVLIDLYVLDLDHDTSSAKRGYSRRNSYYFRKQALMKLRAALETV